MGNEKTNNNPHRKPSIEESILYQKTRMNFNKLWLVLKLRLFKHQQKIVKVVCLIFGQYIAICKPFMNVNTCIVILIHNNHDLIYMYVKL